MGVTPWATCLLFWLDGNAAPKAESSDIVTACTAHGLGPCLLVCGQGGGEGAHHSAGACALQVQTASLPAGSRSLRRVAPATPRA